MPLTLTLTAQSTVPIELQGITPDAVRDKTTAEVERIEIFHGNRRLPLAELFRAAGQADEERIELAGNCAGVHWIGAGMHSGTIHVADNAGRHVGSDMHGGAIHVAGDAGDWVGGEMHGGLIHVRGRAGHLVGAAYRGSRRGMTGGTILIDGAAGNEIAHTMRRGLVAIGGDSGDLIGMNMLAGTILVLGKSGIRHGAGMHRGTIALLGPERPDLLPSFAHACRYSPDILRVLFASLRRNNFNVPDALVEAEYDLFHGDLIEGGRGEILMPAVH